MNRDSQMIEKVVAEVLRRLSALGETPRDDSAAAATPPAPPVPAPGPDALVLDARVITTATIHERLKGVRRVVVDQHAVVTPSVKDELRKRNIRLERQDASAEASDSAELAVVRYTHGDDAVRTAATLPLPANAVDRVHDDLAAAVACVSKRVRDGKQVVVLLTDETLQAACLLNRSPDVRAAIAVTANDVRQAVSAIGVNVLVIDPRAMTENQWIVAVRQFMEDLPRRCPAML